MQPPPDVQPFIVTVLETPTKETTLADVVLGSLGIVGVLVLLALVLGAAVALLLLAWSRRHPPEEDHLPPVVPVTPPSSPAQ